MSLLLGGGGAYAADKNTSARLCAKNARGGAGLCARGGIFVGHYSIDNHDISVFRAVQLRLHCWRGHTW